MILLYYEAETHLSIFITISNCNINWLILMHEVRGVAPPVKARSCKQSNMGLLMSHRSPQSALSDVQ